MTEHLYKEHWLTDVDLIDVIKTCNYCNRDFIYAECSPYDGNFFAMPMPHTPADTVVHKTTKSGVELETTYSCPFCKKPFIKLIRKEEPNGDIIDDDFVSL